MKRQKPQRGGGVPRKRQRRPGGARHRDGHMLRVKRQVAQEPYAGSPDAVKAQFEILETLEMTMERIVGVDALQEVQVTGRQDKLEIQITPSFSMFIQNIVYTTGMADAIVPASACDDNDNGANGPEENEARLDMGYLTRALRYRGCQFNAQRFESVITRSELFDSATLVFATGNIVNTGCCRPEHALWQLSRDTAVLKRILPHETRVVTPRLENLVSSGAFPNTICTCYMTARYGDICSDVGGFPGTLIKDSRNFGDRVIIVFDSGRICHSGGRNPTQIYDDLVKVMPIILDCQATPERVKIEAELRKKREALSLANTAPKARPAQFSEDVLSTTKQTH